MNDPDLLLADEPTGAVDSATSERIQDLFRALNRERGVTVIIVTHDLSLANKVDRVVMIADGKISSERVIKEAYREKIDALAERRGAGGALFTDNATAEAEALEERAHFMSK